MTRDNSFFKIKCGLCASGAVFSLHTDDHSIAARCLTCGADARIKDIEWNLARYIPEFRKQQKLLEQDQKFKRKKEIK